MFVAVVLALAAVTANAEVTLSSDAVDAVGEQQVVLKVTAPAMVHIVVDSAVGTACTLVDHLRGPFLSNGVVGTTSCVVDVLLDAGLYKVRLTSPKAPSRGTPPARARIAATAFVDVDAADTALALRPAEPVSATLPVGHQLVRWIRLPVATELNLDVVGRTAGDVRLWRDGAFVVDTAMNATVVRGESGRPRWRHRLSAMVDAGEYAIVVYGSTPQRFSSGADDDRVQLTWDAAFLPPSGSAEVVIPAWGYAQFVTPGSTALIVVDDANRGAKDVVTDVVLSGSALVSQGDGHRRGSPSASCTVASKSTVRGCTAAGRTGDDVVGTLWELSGPAGARVQVVGLVPESTTSTALPRIIAADRELVFTVDANAVDDLSIAALPIDIDGPPLSCQVEAVDARDVSTRVVGIDAPKLGWTQAWQRRFNVDGGTTVLWFLVERAGMYGITTDAKLGAGCDVYAVSGLSRKRLDGVDAGKGCNLRVPLSAGVVEVAIAGGAAGIEQFRIGQVGVAALLGNDGQAPVRTGCALSTSKSTDGGLLGEPLARGRYRVRTTATRAGTVLAIGRPTVPADGRATIVAVDPGRTVRVAVSAGAALVVQGIGGQGLPRLTADGARIDGAVVAERSTPGVLVLTNTTTSSQTVVVAAKTATAPPTLQTPFAATAPAIPVVVAGSTRWFNLDGTTGKSFLVDVKTAGFYDVQTQGLLSTTCAIRTATTTSLFNGDRNGRGRNCRVEAWLKPGRYLVDVRASGRSIGRAGLAVVARASVDGGPIVIGDERFLSVPAGQLTTHAFTLKRDTDVDLAITTFDADLRCRLDDDDGWPVLPVPHACAVAQALRAGRYTMVVLPLGVDSQRALRSTTATTTPVLQGNKTHPLALNIPATAALGTDGSDAFRFTLVADVDVGILLTAGIQGRLRRLGESGTPGEIEHTVMPAGGSSFSVRSSDEDAGDGGDDDGGDGGEEGGEEGGEAGGYQGAWEDGSGHGDDNGEYGDHDDGGASRATLQAAAVHRAPPPPTGQALSLRAGTWILETEHSRGDVGITYTVSVSTSTLLPGARLRLQAPAVLDVRAPLTSDAGLVRIKTRGGTDVACRLVDDDGVLVASSQGSGDDWNCALAVPLRADRRYRLFIDAEVLVPGPTEVSAEFLEAKSTGPLEDGNAFRVIGKVARADVVAVAGRVTSIELAATEGMFSCALFDHDGRVLDSAVGVKRCPLLVWPADDLRPFSLLLWTADRPAAIKTRLTTVAPSASLFGGSSVVGDGRIAEVKVLRAGRFATAPNARCLSRAQRGVLLPCPTSTALDPRLDGDTMLIGVARGEKATIDFAEVVADPAAAGSDVRRLTAHVDVERQHTDAPRLHVVEVVGRAGSSGGPACAIDGGVRVADGRRCLSASSVGTDSLLRLWTKTGAALQTTVRRASLELPSTATTLPATTTLRGTDRFALPDGPFRLDAALPADAWAVLVDSQGRSVDLCGPAPLELQGAARAQTLRRCVLRGRGGSVVVDGLGAARFDLVRFAAAELQTVLTGLREVKARAPGRERLRLEPIDKARVIVIEGSAVVGCQLIGDDGEASDGCRVELPARRGAEIVVEHGAGPWRALVATTTKPASTSPAHARAIDTALATSRLGTIAQGPVALTIGLAGVMKGVTRAERVKLAAPAVVRVRADSGVCGVVVDDRVVASSGEGTGCDLSTALPVGEHTIAVRGFAGAALTGTVTVTAEPIPTLGEGIGDELLLLPGEARLLRVPLENDGELGIGIQVGAEVLRCALLDPFGVVVAEGCQLFGRFTRGTYLLRVALDDDEGPRRFRPVVFGLKGAEIDVPDAFLNDFFRRVPRPVAPPPPASTSTPSEVR